MYIILCGYMDPEGDNIICVTPDRKENSGLKADVACAASSPLRSLHHVQPFLMLRTLTFSCLPNPSSCLTLLGGSWDLVSRVIGGISNYICSYLTYNPNY